MISSCCLTSRFLLAILIGSLFCFSGSSSEKAKAAVVAAGKRPLVISDTADELRDSGSSKLKIKDADRISQPDLFHSENDSIPLFRFLFLLFLLETDVISALQVVAMMASDIVKAHDIVMKERDDARGIITLGSYFLPP